MAITNASIVTVLNARLRRAETEAALTEPIFAGLTYISGKGRWRVLRTSAATNLVAGNNSIALPANFRIEDRIVLNDGTSDYRPLDKTDYDSVLRARAGSPGRSQPLSYSKAGSNFELNAACDKAYTATVYYWRWHPDQADILFGDAFREAVFNAVMYKYCETKKLLQEAGYYRSVADVELSNLSNTEEDTLTIKARYKDL